MLWVLIRSMFSWRNKKNISIFPLKKKKQQNTHTHKKGPIWSYAFVIHLAAALDAIVVSFLLFLFLFPPKNKYHIYWDRQICRNNVGPDHITKTSPFKYTENFTIKKWKKKSDKNSYIFPISAKNIACGYSLELPTDEEKMPRLYCTDGHADLDLHCLQIA